jgi:hypothetical protein
LSGVRFTVPGKPEGLPDVCGDGLPPAEFLAAVMRGHRVSFQWDGTREEAVRWLRNSVLGQLPVVLDAWVDGGELTFWVKRRSSL